MENFKRNAVGITLLILVAVAIIAVVVIAAVNANKPKVDNEYFIDTAPIDYGAAENVVYVKRFHDTVGDYFNSLSTQINLDGFADRLINALSAARIPAVKLDGLATAIKNNDLGKISEAVNGGQITEDMLKEILNKTNVDILGSFFRSFYEESGLTSEEFGAFIYSYLNLYSSNDYKAALNAVGRENFIELISYTTYFLSAIDEINEDNLFREDGVLSAAFYQLGAVLKAGADGGVENLEKVLGFEWIFGSDRENYEKINVYTAPLKGSLGYLFPLAGCVLKEIDSETLEVLQKTDLSNDAENIYAKSKAIKAAARGIDKFIAEFGNGYGVESADGVFARLQIAMENVYGAIFVASDGNREMFDELKQNSAKMMNNFSAAFELFKETDLTVEELKSMDYEQFERLKKAAEDVDAMSGYADTAVGGIFYMWVSYRMYEAIGED